MELERRRIVLVSMIGGFLGAALAAALFGAGVLFERRRRPGKREAGRMEPPDSAGGAPAAAMGGLDGFPALRRDAAERRA